MAFVLADIRDGTKAVLATVALPGGDSSKKIRAYDIIPDSDIVVPAVVIQPVSIGHKESYGRGPVLLRLRLTILVSAGTDRVGQDQLDAFLSAGTGATSSIIDALETYPGLPTDLTDATTVTATATVDSSCIDPDSEIDYGKAEVSGSVYWKADVYLKILRSRS